MYILGFKEIIKKWCKELDIGSLKWRIVMLEEEN